MEEICTLNSLCRSSWNRVLLQMKPQSQTGWKAYKPDSQNKPKEACPPWHLNYSVKSNPVGDNRQRESAQSINRRVNDQLGLVPLYVFIGSWKHWQMPYTIILDKGCLMNYTKALAEDKPNTFFPFFILFSTERARVWLCYFTSRKIMLFVFEFCEMALSDMWQLA